MGSGLRLYREPDAPGDWLGVIYWQGEGEVSLVDAEITRNGELVHKAEFYEEAILTEEHQSEDFIHSFQSMFTNKNDYIQLLIHWGDNSGTHEDIMVLSPKNHYFVMPRY
ncbi:hypothetical protein P4631_20050 [Halalkalibacterium halodurans]|uniref:BH2902 protein n=1 Tax=Halalkalibacterium halodurans (strain ATCC BAA-125 / DSM 18197 / FERM 7344 / JCM 9153 / C-125) TaxID=272558 RepID=Q9K8V0_HALH5|nr:hypothetical protein [Halalkalibacterium halodurans]MED4174693.1 hypothetical protein [Halalkalibacterium halodurans]BAB06621.1 BH2902 [Halalkalibacterium halodurans C-125]